jgi:hypothetical protein
VRSPWKLTLVPACILAAAMLASCGETGDCGSGGATAPCPEPIYGWARVNGSALNEDGTPMAGERVLFFCPAGVGANDGLTDAAGRFSVFLTYAVADTLQQPFPPRQPDGSFSLECEARLMRAGTEVATWGSFQIPFGPTEAELVESEVELRLPGNTRVSSRADARDRSGQRRHEDLERTSH